MMAAQGKESKFFEKSPAPFGFSSNRRGNIRRTYFWKNRLSVVILFFLTFSQDAASKTGKNRKSKRHLEMQAFGQEQDNKMSARDVHIVPEKLNFHFKRGGTDRPPNHGDSDIRGNTLDQMQEGRTWSPEAFEATAEKYLGASEEVTAGQKAEEGTRFTSGLTRGLVSSIRLKGIYEQPVSKRGNHLEEKFNYPKEINNLMQKGFSSAAEGGKRTLKNGFKGVGAPFKLPEEENERRRTAPKPLPVTRGRRGRPITILLDFYPMKEVGDRFINGKLVRAKKVLEKEGHGIIMKLNLYPGKGPHKERRGKVFDRHTEEVLERVNKTSERKSFGWFSKHKQKRTNRPKECSFMGLNSPGKHITAKWRDKNGDWIYAKRVAVKYWEKEND